MPDTLESLRVRVAELEGQLAAERLQRSRIEACLDGTWDWNVLTGDDVLSPRWMRGLGYEPDALPQTVDTWKALLAPGEYDRAEKAVMAAFADEAPYDIVLRYTRADGSIAHMRARAVVARDEQGAPVRMTGTHTDVTEAVVAQARVQLVSDELQVRNRDLEAFAHVVSHDLKAPLRGIRTLVPWIVEGVGPTIDPELKENLDFLESRARWMERLVSGVLQYSRAIHGTLSWEVHDANELVREALLQVEWEGATIHTESLPSLTVDALRFQQVVLNLVGNAIRHGGARNVHLTSEAVSDGWQFTVQDDGRGFDPARLQTAFRMFSGGADDVSGVGLAICRSLIEKMGGTIHIESEPGAGTQVRFVLPAVEV